MIFYDIIKYPTPFTPHSAERSDAGAVGGRNPLKTVLPPRVETASRPSPQQAVPA